MDNYPMNIPGINPERPVLQVNPEEISINIHLKKEILIELKLTNVTNSRVIFKIKTTAPKLYQVRPIFAVIEPNKTDNCVIVMRPMNEYPNMNDPKQHKHKFLIQSAPVDIEGDFDINAYWKHLESLKNGNDNRIQVYHDTRIPCNLVIPSGDASNYANASSSAPRESFSRNDSSHEVEKLKKELDLKIQEYNGLMDFSIKQTTSNKNLKNALDEFEHKNNTYSTELLNAKKKYQELEARYNKHLEKEDSDRKAIKASRSGFMGILTQPPTFPMFVVFIIFFVGLAVGIFIQ